MIIYGARGQAKMVYDLLRSNNEEPEYIVDDNPPDTFSAPIRIYRPERTNIEGKNVVIAIGRNDLREKVASEIKNWCHFETVIHHTAYVSQLASVGAGTVVMPMACINTEAQVGEHCIINTNAVVEHECVIEDFVHIAPHATVAGNVTVKKGAHIGLGAQVIQGITIGENAIVGAGAVVIRDVPDHVVVVGNPAKFLRLINNNE